MGNGLAAQIAGLERALEGQDATLLDSLFCKFGISSELLVASRNLKQAAGQINVIIHAMGILRCLPHILEKEECVQSLSLGAGNTGKSFDLETDLRVAEFKFIHWRGGPESQRKISLFQDFYKLTEFETDKRKYLYLLGTKHALSFLNGRSGLTTILRNHRLQTEFFNKYGEGYRTVRDYYAPRSASSV